MLVYNGRVSVYSFISTAILSLLALLPFFRVSLEDCLIQHLWWIIPVYYKVVNIFLYFSLRGFPYQVAIRAAFIGIVFSIGALISALGGPSWTVFGWYMCFMAIFHYSEFLMIAYTNPRTLSIDSFILNHSREYVVAAASSWMEFLLERWLFPEMKELTFISLIGVVLCIGGEALRKLAMWTARTNFNHMVQSVREEGHQLVTHGVYGLCRHPSYVGWFYWSIGTQLILVNPICAIAYTIVSWRFFNERVLVEEMTLLNFFGEDYYDYQKKVHTGLPYISGYKLEL